jgi:hypothetical protein
MNREDAIEDAKRCAKNYGGVWLAVKVGDGEQHYTRIAEKYHRAGEVVLRVDGGDRKDVVKTEPYKAPAKPYTYVSPKASPAGLLIQVDPAEEREEEESDG